MQLRYMNGKKVYIDGNCSLDPQQRCSLFEGNIQILQHRELVRALNSLFKDAEENPNDVHFDLWNIIYQLNLSTKRGTHHPKVETVKDYTVKFDDPHNLRNAQKVKKANLREGKIINNYCDGLRLVTSSVNVKSIPTDHKSKDILTPLGKVWLKKERTETDQRDNT